MNDRIYRTGRKYLRMVLVLAAVMLLLSAAFALLYSSVLIADRPYIIRRSAMVRTVSMGMIFTAVLIFCGWFFRDYIRYELCPDRLRISKGRFLRVIDYTSVAEVRERFTGRRYKKRYEIVLKNGTVLPVSPYLDDPDGFAEALRAGLSDS